MAVSYKFQHHATYFWYVCVKLCHLHYVAIFLPFYAVYGCLFLHFIQTGIITHIIGNYCVTPMLQLVWYICTGAEYRVQCMTIKIGSLRFIYTLNKFGSIKQVWKFSLVNIISMAGVTQSPT